jgi:ribosome modulation factor
VVVTPRAYPQTSPEQRAYQAGFQNGQNDRSRNRPMNLTTDNWQGQNLTAYRRGYEDGYRGRGNGPIGAPMGYTTDAERRAYQAGFQNGQNDRSRNKPMNLKTDNWNGQNLTAYQRGYQDGYRYSYAFASLICVRINMRSHPVARGLCAPPANDEGGGPGCPATI